MSEKKAKQKRQDGPPQPKIFRQINATFFDGGGMRVSGFPLEFKSAMLCAHFITANIADYFVKAAKDGRLKTVSPKNQGSFSRARA
ncbi:MAG: hypothetical protein JRJ50_12005 [Deltaproteobacteria bacterium]|nr:hypothetical protein [Deltaproteobacteria bacterium]MBW2342474.1 hypothetical protein [Deltaproteobacteria bacterium]